MEKIKVCKLCGKMPFTLEKGSNIKMKCGCSSFSGPKKEMISSWNFLNKDSADQEEKL